MKPACYSLEQSNVTYDTLKEVRQVEKIIIPLNPLLAALETLMDEIQEANRVLTDANDLDDTPYKTMCLTIAESRKEVASYRIQASYLHRRAQLTAQSVLDNLNLGFQQLAQNQSENTFVMARSAREDSVAIRAIMLVTPFYLPFSFVAVREICPGLSSLMVIQTMFGMNLLDFNSDSRNLVVSNQLWLYFVISVPLTVVTLACWRFSMWRYRQSYLKGEEKQEIGDDIDLEKA
jgi:hypothetical protein